MVLELVVNTKIDLEQIGALRIDVFYDLYIEYLKSRTQQAGAFPMKDNRTKTWTEGNTRHIQINMLDDNVPFNVPGTEVVEVEGL